MFAALGRFVSRKPWYVIGAWVVVGVIIVLTAPGLKATTDQADFLPKHYDSVKAINLGTAFGDAAETPGAEIVFTRSDNGVLTASDQAAVQKVVGEVAAHADEYTSFKPLNIAALTKQAKKQAQLAGQQGGATAKPSRIIDVPLYSADGVTWQGGKDFDSVKALRKVVHDGVEGTDLHVGVTGQGPSSYDQFQSAGSAEAIVMGATVLLIIVLLGFIFRSVLIAIFPIVVIGLVFAVANGAIGWAAKIFDLKVDSSVTTLLVVVLFGIGTDYILFFLFRYRERLRGGSGMRAATADAVERSGEAIASAGGAVIVAFGTLVLSSLGMFRSMGPALAIAVIVTVIAAITLVPAVVTVLGRGLFWPSKKWRHEGKGAVFAKLGGLMERRPAVVAIVSGGILVVLAIFALQFHPNFDLSSGSSTTTESAKTDQVKEKDGLGQGDGAQIMLHATDGSKLTPAEITAFAKDVTGRFGAPVAAVPNPSDPRQPFLSPDGSTAILKTALKGPDTSQVAIDQVKDDLRPAVQAATPEDAEAYVGGMTSVFVDFQSAMNRDYSIVFPVAAIITLLILMLVLRSLVAPWYLMLSVGLGFGATLGASVIVFQHIKGDSGIIFMLPIYIYLFVVALGTDYNILMISRLREEAREGKEPRQAAGWAARHAGPTIAAAGLILAGTFASLMLAGNSLMTAMGFAISFGIAVAAFVMAMFFTPSLTALVGHAAWWPGHGDEKKPEPTDEPELETVR